jgi:hypothetical protein
VVVDCQINPNNASQQRTLTSVQALEHHKGKKCGSFPHRHDRIGIFNEREPTQDAQKGSSARPQAKQEPEAYPLGYVEYSCEPRTPLADFFSILLGM